MSAHKSSLSLRIFAGLNFPVMFTVPASYSCLGVERMFAILKENVNL